MKWFYTSLYHQMKQGIKNSLCNTLLKALLVFKQMHVLNRWDGLIYRSYANDLVERSACYDPCLAVIKTAYPSFPNFSIKNRN